MSLLMTIVLCVLSSGCVSVPAQTVPYVSDWYMEEETVFAIIVNGTHKPVRSVTVCVAVSFSTADGEWFEDTFICEMNDTMAAGVSSEMEWKCNEMILQEQPESLSLDSVTITSVVYDDGTEWHDYGALY